MLIKQKGTNLMSMLLGFEWLLSSFEVGRGSWECWGLFFYIMNMLEFTGKDLFYNIPKLFLASFVIE